MQPQPKTSATDALDPALTISSMRPGRLVSRHDLDADVPPLEQIQVPGELGRAATGAWPSFEVQLSLPSAPSAADLASVVGRTVAVLATDGRFRREIISKIDAPTVPGGQGVAYLRLDPADSTSRINGYRLVHRARASRCHAASPAA